MLFKLVVLLAIVYIILKMINTNAKLKEKEAERAAEKEARIAEEEAFEEDEITRAEAVDVEPEIVEDAEKEEE